MKKRIVSILTAAILIMGLIPVTGVFAAISVDTNSELYWTVSGKNNATIDKTIEVVTGEGINDSHALHISSSSASTNTANDWTFVCTDVLPNGTLEEGAVYELSAYIKGVTNINQVGLLLGDWTTIYFDETLNTDEAKVEQIDDEWYKFTIKKTAVSGKNLTNPGLTIKTNVDEDLGTAEMVEFYADNISLRKVNDDGSYGDDILAGAPGTFDEVRPADAIAGTESDLNIQGNIANYWMIGGRNNFLAKSKRIQIKEGVGIDGTNAMHVEANSNQDDTVFEFQINTVLINSTTTLTSGNTYELSAYVKNIKNMEKMGILLGGYTTYTFDETAVQTGKTVENIGDGWYKVTVTAAANQNLTNQGFSVSVNKDSASLSYEEIEVYIDNVTLRDVTDPTNPGSNILAGTAGTFDEIPFPEPGTLEDFTEGDGWTVTYQDKDNYTDLKESGVREAGISSAVSYSGLNSLYTVFSCESESTNVAMRVINNFVYTQDNTYTLTFYMLGKIENGSNFYTYAGWVNQPTNGSARVSLTNMIVSDPEDEAKKAEGWKKYTCTIVPNNSIDKFTFVIQGTATEAYIDNISLIDASGNECLTGIGGSFEDTVTEAYSVAKAQIYDGNTSVSKLDTTLGGKEITAKTRVANWSNADGVSAQLIVALYKGYELVDVNVSKVTNIASGKVEDVSAEITLPTITDGNLADYEVRVFVWNSLTGMFPLTSDVSKFNSTSGQ